MEAEVTSSTPPVTEVSKPRRILGVVCSGVVLIYALTVMGHWNASLPGGTDSSWMRQLHEVFLHDVVFGRDLIWTFGPWGFLYYFATPQTLPFVLVGRAFLAFSCWLGLWALSKNVSAHPAIRSLWSLACLAAIALAEPNLSLFAPALLLFVLALSRERPTPKVLIVLAIAVALASLVKVSAGIVSGCLVTIIGVNDLLHRRAPWVTCSYFAALLVFWLLAAQPVGAVFDFIGNAWEMSRSYAQVMGTESFRADDVIKAFLASGAAMVTVALVARWRDGRIAALAYAGGLILWLFVVFKGACVRQGDHLLFAGPAAFFAVMLVLTSIPRNRWMYGGIALSAALALYTSETATGRPQYVARSVLSSVTTIPQSFGWLGRRITGSAQWPAPAIVWQDPRGQPDLSDVPQPVDVFPWQDFDLKSRGIERHSRPVMESYQSATPYLSGLNAKFFASDSGPKTLVWNVFPLDDHLATMEDALSWPAVLAHFDCIDQRGDYLILTRSAHPRTYELVPLTSVTTNFDAMVDVPQTKSGMVWLSLDLTPSPWLKVRTFLYKPIPIRLELEESGRGSLSYRVIPEMATCGFLVNPLIHEVETFRALFPGQSREALAAHQVLKVGLTRAYPSEPSGYAQQVTFHFFELRFSQP
jgi:hypothetical protein